MSRKDAYVGNFVFLMKKKKRFKKLRFRYKKKFNGLFEKIKQKNFIPPFSANI